MRRLLISFLAGSAFLSHVAASHPMGNFSVNRWTSLTIGADAIEIVHVVDLAEIPTQMELTALDGPAEGARLDALRKDLVTRTLRGLDLRVNDVAKTPLLEAASLTVVPGAGGLPTLRLELRLRAEHAARGEARVTFKDTNFEGRVGWKEIIANGTPESLLASSDVPKGDRSRRLTAYPADPLLTPAEATEANLVIRPRALARAAPAPAVAAAPSTPKPSPIVTPTAAPIVAGTGPKPKREDALTSLVHAPTLSPSLVAIALFAAFGLGALHALSPGHGKTIVAAYLVGSRGTAFHALLLGAVVTASHTAGVFALGFVTLSLSKSIVPERLFPAIELVSGIAIAAVGTTMLARRLRRKGEPTGDHEHGGPLGHTHDASDAAVPEGTPTLTALLVLGASGGILPCPSALVVLLSAIALGRVAFGLLLIVAFSLGLASVLSLVGILVVKASRLLSRSARFGVWAARVPVFSALLVALLGLALSGKALADVGLFRIPF